MTNTRRDGGPERPRVRGERTDTAAPSPDFDRVRRIGLDLFGVETATRYDGSPLLKVGGRFMAGLATHPSAEPGTLVARCEPSDRDLLLAEAPETYYVTESYRPHPVVLARLAALDDGALRDLLSLSRRLTLRKGTPRQPRGGRDLR